MRLATGALILLPLFCSGLEELAKEISLSECGWQLLCNITNLFGLEALAEEISLSKCGWQLPKYHYSYSVQALKNLRKRSVCQSAVGSCGSTPTTAQQMALKSTRYR